MMLLSMSVASVFAQVSTPRFTLSAASYSLVTGQSVTVTIGLHVPMTAKITGVDAVVTAYDPTIISATPLAFSASGTIFPSNHGVLAASNMLKFTSSITQAGTFFSQANTGAYQYAQFTLSALRAGTTTIRFACSPGVTNDSNIVAYGTGADIVDCAVLPTIVVNVSAPTPTPTPSPIPTPVVIPVCLSISPNIASPVYGQSVHFTCSQVIGATSYSFRYRLQGPNGLFTDVIAPLFTGSNVSMPLTYSQAGIYDVECQACIGTSCSASCTMQAVIASPATAPPLTPAPTPTPVVRLMNFSAKFEGVTKDVGLISASYVDDTGAATVLLFNYINGVYKATLSTEDQTRPSMISFQIKPEKHLQRVFRNLTMDTLDFDLTQKPFEPGDLPLQDGVVDIIDIGSVVSILAKSSQTSDDRSVGDLNYDGIVNAADVGAILTTLSTHPDESL